MTVDKQIAEKESTDCLQTREEYFKKYKNRLEDWGKSVSERLDYLLVTLSTTGLGMSLTTIPRLFDFKKMLFVPLLYVSWISFIIVIISTICGLLLIQYAFKKSIKYAKKYYLDNKADYLDKKSCADRVVSVLNYVSAVAFFLAVLFTLIFVMVNVSAQANSQLLQL